MILVTVLMNTDSKTGNRDEQIITVKTKLDRSGSNLYLKKEHFQHIFPESAATTCFETFFMTSTYLKHLNMLEMAFI